MTQDEIPQDDAIQQLNTEPLSMKPINTDWTPALVAKFRALVADGLSDSRIADELAMTRNAVVGKRNRLGLRRSEPKPKPLIFKPVERAKRLRWDPRRNSQAQKIQAGPKINPNSLPSTPDAELSSKQDLDIPECQRKNIWTLDPRDCKFIVGDPATPEHFYCGARKLPTLPYCADHAWRCYHPARGAL